MKIRILLIVLIPLLFIQCDKKKDSTTHNATKPANQAVDSAASIIREATLLNVKTWGNVDSLKKAISMLDEAIALDSHNRNAYFYKAEYLTKLGNIPEANATVNQALRLFPIDPYTSFSKGLLCEKAGLKDSATLYYQLSIQLFSDSIQLKPNDFGLNFNRAFVYAFVDSMDRTIKDLTALQSRYDTTTKEYNTVSPFLKLMISDFDREKFVEEFWK